MTHLLSPDLELCLRNMEQLELDLFNFSFAGVRGAGITNSVDVLQLLNTEKSSPLLSVETTVTPEQNKTSLAVGPQVDPRWGGVRTGV